MKILFFISSLTNSGAERAMSNITMNLPENVEADILLNAVSENDFPTKARKISLGMPSEGNMGIAYQLKALFKRLPVLARLKKENHYDACISFMDSANICNILTGNRHCKTIISVRVSVEQDQTWTYKYIVRPLVRLFYKKADCIAAVSEGVRNGLIRYFKLEPSKIVTITNGYDVASIHAQMQEKCEAIDKKDGDFIFAAAGRMRTQKAQWHLIRAFSKVVEACPGAKLVIMGEGNERRYLESLVTGYGLEDRVTLLPYQRKPFAVLAKCDVFVMPSMFEGYCNALCEAIICGLPCIATDFMASAREILAPDTSVEYRNTDKIEYAKYGIIVPVCSGKKYQVNEPLEMQEILLADAMTELYQNRERYNGYKELLEKRAQELDIKKKVSEWLELIDTDVREK